MKHNKRNQAFCLSLIFLLVIGFSACGGGAAESPTTATVTDTSATVTVTTISPVSTSVTETVTSFTATDTAAIIHQQAPQT